MKKTLLTIVSFLCISVMVGCSDSKENSDSEPESSVQDITEEENGQEETIDTSSEPKTSEIIELSSTDNDNLVVYFSATGTTENVAQRIALVLNSDLQEIIPAQEYTRDDINWSDDNCRAAIEMNDVASRPEISGERIPIDDYSTIYIGYPIWWGDAPRIMNTFVESYDFGDKTIIPFCTSGSSDIGESSENLRNLATGGNWLTGRRLDANISESDIQEWINSLS
ncbi:MAG: flavodoxin [Ruminococcus sp.]|nr:flavodoxin [Ruminococcus sp.]